MASDRNKRKGGRKGGAAAAVDTRPQQGAFDDKTEPNASMPAPPSGSPAGESMEAEIEGEVSDGGTTTLSATAISGVVAEKLGASDDQTEKTRPDARPAGLAALPTPPPAAPAPRSAAKAAPRSQGLGARVADAAAAKLLVFDDLPDDEKPRKDDRVLLLGLIWGGETLVELEQIPQGTDLKVGTLFDLPASNLPKDFRLVQHVASDLVITVPADLKTEVHHSGGRATDSLEQLSSTGKARRVDAPFKGFAYTIQSDDRIVVQVAPNLMLVARYVRGFRQKDKTFLDMVDVPFATTLIIALLALCLFWMMLRIAPRSDDMLGDDLTRNRAQFTKYQVKPPEEIKQPKFKELSGVKEGAKAKGDEGKFGKQDAKKKEADASKKGAPVVDPNKQEKDRQTVMKTGLLAALSKLGANSGGAASNVLGPGGLGTGINNALGGVKGGAGQGDAYGVGGLGSRGAGGGGGGTALGIGGLGTKGDGHGKGGYGEIDLGGRGKDETQFIPGKTSVVGGLSRDVINRVIQRHYNEIKYCYEKELSHDPGLYGKVTVSFIIDAHGRVGDALVQQTTMSSEPVETCMMNHVKRWVFPAPSAGGETQVSYPYVFKASGQ
jgi:hypothetical protein